MRVLIFSTILTEKVVILIIFKQDTVTHLHRSSRKVPFILLRFE